MNASTKRLLSLLLSLAMVLAMLPLAVFAETPSTLYLQPNDNWVKDGARFAAVLATEGWSAQVWVDATDADGDGVYEVAVPDDGNAYSIVIFCRMNPGSTNNDWGNKWNQTADLNIPTDGTNCYIVAAGSWDNGNGQWTKFAPGSVIETQPTEPVAAGYYVAGSMNGWKENNADYLMNAQEDGTYALTLAVTAGSYELKVTDGTWSNSWGTNGQNYCFTAETDGEVTVTFDPASGSVNVTGDCLGGGEEPTEPAGAAYYVAGTMNGWTNPDAAYLMNAQEDGTYSLTFAVTAGDHELKVTDGTWDNSWGKDGQNYVFAAETDGEVTVTFNPADFSVNVTGDCLGGGEEPSDPVETAYYVAGEEKLCGVQWDPAAEANKLSDEDGDGVYSISYAQLAAGDYMFKVTNGTWEQCWGGDGTDGNYVFRLYALSNVTVNFTPATGIITLDIEELGEPEDPTVPAPTAYYVAGSFNGWTSDDANYKMNDNGDGTWSLSFVLPAIEGACELKVTDGTWTNAWPGDNITVEAAEGDTVNVSFDGTNVNVTVEAVKEPLTIMSMHVAGSGGLTGCEWDPTANQMDCAMGVYTITFTNVVAGTYEFKFVANGSWDLNWASGIEMPSGETQTAWFKAQGNSSVVVAEEGSTVTLTFNMTTMDILTGEGATTSVVVEAPEAPVSKDLVLGDNAIVLEAGDRDGDTWNFTAAEAGTLSLNITALTTDNGMGELEAVPAEYLSQVMARNFGVVINGTPVYEYPVDMTVAAGDVVSVLIYSGMGAPAEMTLNLVLTADTGDSEDGVNLVTDIADLQVGDQIIIAALEYDMAISTTQNKNNRDQAEIVKDGTAITYGEDVQIITLVEGTVDGTFGFQVGEGQYLYAAGGTKNNYLKLTDTMEDNASWAIVIDGTTGEASIVASGESTRNTLRYNLSSTLFSCYAPENAGKQKALCIYKISAAEEEPSNALVLGDNELTLEAGDVDGGSWTFTATEDGALYLNVTAMTADNMGMMEEVPVEYLSTVFRRQYTVLVDGVQFDLFSEYYLVSAGDVVSIQIISNMANATELTLNLSIGEVPTVEPAEPGTWENPLVIEALPYEITVDGDHDIYYTYTAEQDGTIVITAPEGNLVSGLSNYEKVGNTYYSTVAAGETVSINPWGSTAGTYTIAYGDAPVYEDVTVYFDASLYGWTTVNAYAWSETGEQLGMWPGTAMTLGEDGLWSITVSNQATNILFNNGDSFQTVDQKLAADTVYDGFSSAAYGTELNTKFYITGNGVFGEWDAANAGGVMTNNGDGTFTVTFTGVEAGSYQYKVTAGNWDQSWGDWATESGNYELTVDKKSDVTFTWDLNNYTVSVTQTPVEDALKLIFQEVSVSFKDEFLVNIYFSGVNMDKVVKVGMLTYSQQVAEYSVATAEHLYDCTFNAETGLYRTTTGGISAKNMGDTFWLALYAELEDGSYYYTKLNSYSPAMYAYTMLGREGEDLDRLLVSMLNFGAAAQLHFNHNTDNLVNKDLTAEQKALVADYSSDMVNISAGVPAEKQGAFANNGGFSNKYPSVSFKGSFVINYYGTPAVAPADGITLYYWDETAFAANEVLTAENATGTVEMAPTANGEYAGSVTGTPARKLNSIVYVAFTYTDGTTTYNSGVLPYSIGEYCGSFANTDHEFAPMAEATAVYGSYAKAYFG